MNKNIIVSFLAVLVIAIGLYYYLRPVQNAEISAKQEQTPVVPAPAQVGTTSSTSTVTTPRKAVTVKVPTINISIANFAFLPRVAIIDKGNKVVWTNNDSAPHQIAGAGVLNGPVMGNGQSYSYVFTKTGTYNYHCNINQSIAGTIIVK